MEKTIAFTQRDNGEWTYRVMYKGRELDYGVLASGAKDTAQIWLLRGMLQIEAENYSENKDTDNE